MSTDIKLLPAPPLRSPEPASKWAREYAAFQRMLPDLLRSHPGEFVAIHAGGVVAHGSEEVAVIQAAYAKVGYVTLHVGRVTSEPQPPGRIRSPRRAVQGGSE